jgi:hypothetical protein
MPNFFIFSALNIMSKYKGIIHNEIYEELQNKYMETKDNKILGQMYSVAKNCAYNYIKKYYQSHGLYNFDISEKSHDAALFVIEQYLKKPEFKIDKISAYVYFGVQKSLFKNKDIEMNEVSYDAMIEKKEHKNK